ncbi:C_GCAxxG_C_C family protein [Candidatus Moduliflexus flocculans]|uniref:C_GCAxxG_C_C family protein n=1 Tax=Candidatus Moduliflexus flocculans TaxID=1499966 RepID=A0A081BPC2_9BACT|nr:C_GCAxxG_C_C family protein [Candidatus Moduliflexus flocculans]
MDIQQIEQNTFGYYQAGFHCAEAILQAITEAFGAKEQANIPNMASAFCGGVGGTKQDICGALTGGLMAIGVLCGRQTPDKDLRDVKALASDLRAQFLAEYGSTQCQAVLNKLGQQEHAMKCKALTAHVAGVLAQLLLEKGLAL